MSIDKKEIRLLQHDQRRLDNMFIDVCRKGDLEAVKYMLTSPDLQLRPDFTHIEEDRYDGLTTAAANGHLHVVEYLLFSPELENHDCFPPFLFDYLRLICDGGHYHVADYLREKKVFRPVHVFHEVHYFATDIDALSHYLIFNCDIKTVPEVQKIIDRSPEIAKLFDIRDLNKELREELVVSDSITKKIKL
jgi:hypothetical protein